MVSTETLDATTENNETATTPATETGDTEGITAEQLLEAIEATEETTEGDLDEGDDEDEDEDEEEILSDEDDDEDAEEEEDEDPCE